MSNYNTLKTTIDANIKQNGNQEITGQILNSVLNAMVTTLGTGYQFAGVATIATNPGTPDAKVFYIANGKGTYEKFGGLEVTEDDVVVLYYDTAWHKVSTGIASQAKLSELEEKVANAVSITYAELKSLRDAGKLVPGQQYRITDYTCTTTQANTKSAEHIFDIIVTADDERTLNEIARAAKHYGDTYFANSDLNAWKIWYCLDNDTNRFTWADATNGKGVIYRMIDEWNNDVPYDFKNIQFKRYILDANNAIATDVVKDGELNVVKAKLEVMSHRIHTNLWYYGSYVSGVYPAADENTKYVPFGDVFYNGEGPGVLCPINEENFEWFYTFSDNSFNDVTLTIQGYVHNNVIKSNKQLLLIIDGEGRYSFEEQEGICLNDIIFIGNYCYSNSLGNNCYSNSFGNYCNSNSFGNDCYSNSLGNDCNFNSFGNYCYSNSLGNSCNSIKFASSTSASTKYNYYQYNHFGDGCQYIVFTGAGTAGWNEQVQNYNFSQGLQGTDSAYLTIDGKRNLAYETKVAKNSNGEIKIYCEADLIL